MVGYETGSGELHVPNMLKHTQEGTPEKGASNMEGEKPLHVDDLFTSEVRKGEEESQREFW